MTKFDFDIHALRQVKDTFDLALGKAKPHNLKVDFEKNIATMCKFAKEGLNWTARDVLMSLDKTIKVEPAKAHLYARRDDIYGSAQRWHRSALNVLIELGCVIEVTRGEYKFADNDFANAIRKAFEG